MKTAIVYDYVPEIGGGAERALLELAAHFKKGEVDIFFGFVVLSPFSRRYIEQLEKEYGENHIHVGPSIRYAKPFIFRIYNFLLPALQHLWNFQSYDLVICYTAFLAHSIVPPIKGKQLVYMNTPARFLWNLSHAQSFMKRLFSPFLITDIMRYRSQLYDIDAIEHSQNILAISNETAKRIRTFYNKNAKVLYPASVPDPLLYKNWTNRKLREELGTFFVHVSRVESYKNIDILVETALSGGLDTATVVIGTGPYLKELKRKAQKGGLPRFIKNITSLGITAECFGPLMFTDYVEEDVKFQLLANASASFSLNDEDFGITKVESLAVGTPVIGYAAGATPELIKDGKNGILYGQNTPRELLQAIARHLTTSYNREDIRATAKPFTNGNFHVNLEKFLHA